MFGREVEPHDRGPFLWPPLQLLVACFMSCLKSHFPLECLLMGIVICYVLCPLKDWLFSWWMHWRLASLISAWHSCDLKKKMKSLGIKPRWTPLPGRLRVLPCNLMVLSAVMMSMYSVAMAGHVPVSSSPVTWVEAADGILGIATLPPLPGIRIPPDPDPTLDGEGRRAKAPVVNQVPDQDPPVDDAEWAGFKITTGCCPKLSTALGSWTDLHEHVFHCNFSPFSSFGPLGLLAAGDHPFQAIVDTGASLTITPFREDFVDYIEHTGLVVQGLSKGASIAGVGTVEWLIEVGDKTVSLKLRALHVPSAEKRLLCPQQIKQEAFPDMPEGRIGDEAVYLDFPEGTVQCVYNESNLPVILLSAPKETAVELGGLNACLMLETNQNLTASQKELLKWHTKLGHCDLKRVQRLMKTGALGHSPLIKAAANVDFSKRPLICGSCAFGKAKRRAKKTKTSGGLHPPKPPEPEKLLSKEALIPGQKVSMDHFIVSTPGRLFTSRGRESLDRMFKGGVIFVDHASGFVYVVPVVNFTAGEALRAKREFESEMASMGVTVLNFHTDNGVFTATEFQDELARLGQGMTLSGVGAHHQNAVAERMIGVTVSMARTMMLHAKMRWPKAVTTKLWPMALKHAQHLINHLPDTNNVCPMDLILKTTVPRQALMNMHVWGCPSFVLDPKLQDGGHIPKFEPRARQGLNLGWSPNHASTVPLILNLTTGNVSPQFHVVFDDWFTTVDSSELSLDDGLESKDWTELFANSRFLMYFDENDSTELDDEWLTEIERIEKHKRATARVNSRMPNVQRDTATSDVPPKIEKPVDEPPVQPDATVPDVVPTLQPTETKPVDQREPVPRPKPAMSRELKNLGTPPVVTSRLRLRLGSSTGMLAGMATLFGNLTALQLAGQAIGKPAAHAAMKGFDVLTETYDHIECHTFQALVASKSKAKKGEDPDFPTYHQAMLRPDADEWLTAMEAEIDTLMKMNTWTVVPRQMAIQMGKPVIKSTWAFRQKRDPAGLPTKKKARFCVRGDIQKRTEQIESFSPVVQWSSVRLLLILSIVHGLATRQVDYVNAFAQAELNKDVFIELPQGFNHSNDEDCVLKLNKSLYGMTDAPLIFFELLKSNLEKIGFEQYKSIDSCLFVHKDAICLTYVDNCLWFGQDPRALDKLIQDMKSTGMDLTVESDDVSAFLGIQFTRKGDTIELKQLGLIDKIIEATGMQDANAASVPADAKTLGKDKDGEPFQEDWNFRSVVGMLLYLAGNSRPDIAFAVHQAARFSHDPKKSHGVAVKRIVRYLKGTRDRGMIFKPTGDWKVDCFVDADFCGLWGTEDPDDPIVSKSRTGFIITLAGCPLLWVSKLQTETSVSTMMAEYVALSSAMRELLPLKRLVKAVAKVVTGDDKVQVVTKSDVFEDNNGALTVATMPRITPQSKFFAVKLHFFREHVKTASNPNGEVEIQKIETTKQLADIMTKGLTIDKFTPLRDALMGWDLDETGTSKLFANLHSRGSVGNVRRVTPYGKGVQFAPQSSTKDEFEIFSTVYGSVTEAGRHASRPCGDLAIRTSDRNIAYDNT